MSNASQSEDQWYFRTDLLPGRRNAPFASPVACNYNRVSVCAAYTQVVPVFLNAVRKTEWNGRRRRMKRNAQIASDELMRRAGYSLIV